MSNAFGVRKVMDGIRNTCSQAGERAERRVQVCQRAAMTFSTPPRSVDEYAAASRWRAASRMDWVPTKSGPNPQTERTFRGDNVVRSCSGTLKGMVLSIDGSCREHTRKPMELSTEIV